MSDVGPSPVTPIVAPSEAVLESPRRRVLTVWLRDLVISLAISCFIIVFLYQPVKVEEAGVNVG